MSPLPVSRCVVVTLSRTSGMRRDLSTSGCCLQRLVTLEREEGSGGGIATLLMDNPPVNSFSSDFSSQMATAVREAQEDGKTRALLIKSTIPSVFAAGLNLKVGIWRTCCCIFSINTINQNVVMQDVLELTEDNVRPFWSALQVRL